jgi:hypothetical protein
MAAMAKARRAPGGEPQLSDTVKDLTVQVEQLSRRLDLLYGMLDEVRGDLAWALQNDTLGRAKNGESLPVIHITSMPKDPCAPDFGERVNRYAATDLPAEEKRDRASDEHRADADVQQGQLFD